MATFKPSETSALQKTKIESCVFPPVAVKAMCRFVQDFRGRGVVSEKNSGQVDRPVEARVCPTAM